jgi:hypothetical protein
MCTQREGRTLTVADYVATGGIRGSLGRSAEEVYARLSPRQRRLVRDMLLLLVTTGEEDATTPVRVPRRRVAQDEWHEEIVEMLVGARLLTSDDRTIALTHESLARSWPRFVEWRQEDIEGQRIRRHLSGAAYAWDTMGRPASELYRGMRLDRALDWATRMHPELTPLERDFLDQARAREDDEHREARARAAGEVAARRHTQHLLVALAVALLVALTAMVALGVVLEEPVSP